MFIPMWIVVLLVLAVIFSQDDDNGPSEDYDD